MTEAAGGSRRGVHIYCLNERPVNTLKFEHMLVVFILDQLVCADIWMPLELGVRVINRRRYLSIHPCEYRSRAMKLAVLSTRGGMENTSHSFASGAMSGRQ